MKDQLLQVRMTAEEMDRLHRTVEDLKEKGYQPAVTVSSLVRQALDRWNDVYEDLKAGKYLVMLETGQIDADDLQAFLNGLVDIKRKAEANGQRKLERLVGELHIDLMLHAGEILRNAKKQRILRELEGVSKNG